MFSVILIVVLTIYTVVPASAEKCFVNGRSYKTGEEFVSPDCSGSCKCHRGIIFCVSLCPPEGISCHKGEKTKKLLRKIPNTNCSCPTWRCLKIQDDDNTAVVGKLEDECIVGDYTYNAGEDFVSPDCSSYCKCYTGGSVVCGNLCPKDIEHCTNPNEVKVQTFKPVQNTNCSCLTWTCQIKIQDTCVFDGIIRKVGERFIPSDCSGVCSCLLGGGLQCVSLCPPVRVVCKHNETEVQIQRKIRKSNCSCPSWKCVKKVIKDTCVFNGIVRKIGERFVPSDCSGYCQCLAGGNFMCVSLCPPERIVCKNTEIKVQTQRKIQNSNCSCPSWKCVKKIWTDTCVFDGVLHNVGETFITSDCLGQCKCYVGGGVGCVSLCPPVNIFCKDDETKVQIQRKIPNSNCSCPSWKCVRKSRKGKCIYGNSVYDIGEEFIPPDCKSYCKCSFDGNVNCGSLCMRQQTLCKKHEVQVQYPRKVLNSNCTCPSLKCIRNGVQDFPAISTKLKKPLHLLPKLSENLVTCVVGEVTYQYPPGVAFVTSDCSASCKCRRKGDVVCVGLCPPKGITCQHDEDVIDVEEKVPNSYCHCPSWKCAKIVSRQKRSIPVAIPICVKRKQTNQLGKKFVPANCMGVCKCFGTKGISCVSLCPPHGVLCGNNQIRIETVTPPILGSNCTCPTWKCVPKVVSKQRAPTPATVPICVKQKQTNQLGKRFVPADCSGVCKCSGISTIGCVSLCPPHVVGCGNNETKIETVTPPILGSNCTCPTWKCVPKVVSKQRAPTPATVPICVKQKQTNQLGKRFVPADCSGVCKCSGTSTIGCVSLCPPHVVVCGNNETRIETVTPPILDSNCRCPTWKCVPKVTRRKKREEKEKIISEGCLVDGKSYDVGQKFVSLNCTASCTCAGLRTYGCVPLCPPYYTGPCRMGETRINVRIPRFGTNCTCPSWKCMKNKGKWTKWSKWTTCDAPCGGGRRYKYRSCIGRNCVGSTYETQVCNLTPCNTGYLLRPCGSLRLNKKVGGLWPRCDNHGFFTPLQCNPEKSECWCVDKWGNETPRTRLYSEKPQCTTSK